ncbi:hypothetical protein BCU08_16945 [Vibrio splendidus]|nr:hypothetical protein BCU08_16945 [Vibrio splendidus]
MHNTLPLQEMRKRDQKYHILNNSLPARQIYSPDLKERQNHKLLEIIVEVKIVHLHLANILSRPLSIRGEYV